MSKVAIVRTKPETVLQDVQRVMQLAEVRDALVVDTITIIKNNLSWHLMYPGANTTPWQLEGTILGYAMPDLKSWCALRMKQW